MNYFELFEFPVAPVVDRSSVSKKYFALQKKTHPDFFTQASESEKEEVLKLSADINKAFGIFSDPQKTIEYFLQVKGLIEADEKYNLPPDFLMEMMELNESMMEEGEEATAAKVEAYESQLFEEIAPLLNSYNAKETPADALLKLKAYYYKKKYLNRILDRLSD